MTELRIRQGSIRDFDAVLGLLDEAVEWLVARGQTGQWGSGPFSHLEVAWYERQGFVRSDIFELRGWRGQVFEMEL